MLGRAPGRGQRCAAGTRSEMKTPFHKRCIPSHATTYAIGARRLCRSIRCFPNASDSEAFGANPKFDIPICETGIHCCKSAGRFGGITSNQIDVCRPDRNPTACRDDHDRSDAAASLGDCRGSFLRHHTDFTGDCAIRTINLGQRRPTGRLGGRAEGRSRECEKSSFALFREDKNNRRERANPRDNA